MITQSLSFKIVVASNAPQVWDACRVRAAGYHHHLPDLQSQYLMPDAADAAGRAIILVCYDKQTASAVGTARVHVTHSGARMPVQDNVDISAQMIDAGVAEVTRLAIVAGADPIVRAALFKAVHLICLANAVRYVLLCARSPALISIYRKLGAVPLHADRRMVRLGHVGNIPHAVLSLDLLSIEGAWRASDHPLNEFIFATDHPDTNLDVDSVAHSTATCVDMPWLRSHRSCCGQVQRTTGRHDAV